MRRLTDPELKYVDAFAEAVARAKIKLLWDGGTRVTIEEQERIMLETQKQMRLGARMFVHDGRHELATINVVNKIERKMTEKQKAHLEKLREANAERNANKPKAPRKTKQKLTASGVPKQLSAQQKAHLTHLNKRKRKMHAKATDE